MYSESISLFFKHTQNVFRIVDKKRGTLVYVAISDKIIEGSPRPHGPLAKSARLITSGRTPKAASKAQSALCRCTGS